MSATRQEGGRRYCLADLTDGSGNQCHNSAGFKTVHPGYGRCHLHLGNTKNLVLAAAREQAQEIASISSDIDVDPDEVLISSIGRAWGVVHWAAARLSGVEEAAVALNADEDMKPAARAKEEARLSKLLLTFTKLYGEWMDRAAGLSELALKLGLEERRVKLAERIEDNQVDFLEHILRAILTSPDVAMSEDQQTAAMAVLDAELQISEEPSEPAHSG